MVETLFSNKPIVGTKFVDKETGKELASVIMEDEGDYWTILTGTNDHSTLETIDKDIRHPDPLQYAMERQINSLGMVFDLLDYSFTMKAAGCKDDITTVECRRR